MSPGWAEREIRQLPGVMACAISPLGVSVLVSPGTDAAMVTAAAAAVAAAAGIDRPVRVLGVTTATSTPSPPRRHAPLLGAAVAGVAVLAAVGGVAITGGPLGQGGTHARATPRDAAAAVAGEAATHRVAAAGLGGVVQVTEAPGAGASVTTTAVDRRLAGSGWSRRYWGWGTSRR